MHNVFVVQNFLTSNIESFGYSKNLLKQQNFCTITYLIETARDTYWKVPLEQT